MNWNDREHVDTQFKTVLALLAQINGKVDKLMGFVEDMQAGQQATKDVIAQLGVDITNEIADLKAKIVAASAGAITPAQATTLLQGMTDITSGITALSTQAKAE